MMWLLWDVWLICMMWLVTNVGFAEKKQVNNAGVPTITARAPAKEASWNDIYNWDSHELVSMPFARSAAHTATTIDDRRCKPKNVA